MIYHLDETHSTNSYLTEKCRSEALPEFSVATTNFQTAGRGQRGNSWESERGKNLLFSLLLYPSMVEAKEQFILSQMIALSIYDILKQHTNFLSIKWPNDIYWKEKKIAGILIENELIGTTIKQSIIGVGVNVNQLNFKSDAPNPISLREITGKHYDNEVILHEIIARLKYYYSLLSAESTVIIKNNYLKALFRNEGFHLYKDNGGKFRARIITIEPSGELILQKENGERKGYFFKEVFCVLE